jgi:hypothetical protein
MPTYLATCRTTVLVYFTFSIIGNIRKEEAIINNEMAGFLGRLALASLRGPLVGGSKTCSLLVLVASSLLGSLSSARVRDCCGYWEEGRNWRVETQKKKYCFWVLF